MVTGLPGKADALRQLPADAEEGLGDAPDGLGADPFRDPLEVQVVPEAQLDHRAGRGGELFHAAPQDREALAGDLGRAFRPPGAQVGGQRPGAGLALAGAAFELLLVDVARDAREPGEERQRRVVAAQGFQGAHERFLRHLVEVVSPEPQARGVDPQRELVVPDELAERLPFARPGPGDELTQAVRFHFGPERLSHPASGLRPDSIRTGGRNAASLREKREPSR